MGDVVWRYIQSSRRRVTRPSTGILWTPSLISHRVDKVYFECTRSETERKSGIQAVPDIVPDPFAFTEKTVQRCYDPEGACMRGLAKFVNGKPKASVQARTVAVGFSPFDPRSTP